MKWGNLILLGLVILAGIGAAVVAGIIHNGVSARGTPTALEAMIAGKMRRLALPSDARAQSNPVADSAEVQREARLHFADHCAICHGNDGSGDTPIGRGLYPKPPDLRTDHTQRLSDGEIFWIIENGVRLTGMPAFGGAEHGTSADSWKLVRFIRHLPHLTGEERMEMERYNPKGPDERDEEKNEQDFLNGAAEKPGKGSPHHH
jgi:mono/diheme cytochrome c family protein